MGFKEYGNYDTVGLAELVRNKQVTPRELLDEAVARTTKVDPQINAVVVKHYDYAERQIERGLPDGPFTGVPFLLKDLDLLEGTRTTSGATILKDYVADHTTTLTQRFLDTGVTIFGKSSSPEFGLMPTTNPVCTGPLAIPGISSTPPAARPAVRRQPSLPAFSPSPMPATAAARSGFRRRPPAYSA